MRLLLVAAGTRLPSWVNEGYREYASRLTGEYRLELKEIPLGTRSGSDTKQAIAKEAERMSAAIPPNAYVVALQVHGRALTSEQLAQFLETRARDGRDVAFCIGGPDGLPQELDARADYRWSLSALTLPHALVRGVPAEAAYRRAEERRVGSAGGDGRA